MQVKILIPYFGTLPPWIHHFLESCRYNEEYTWLFICDTEKPSICPGNTHFHKFSLEEFNRLASENLGLNINIHYPYKICDLRPAYGLIFSEFLSDADFWGYSDLDLIYGRFSDFLSPEILRNSDVISPREEYFAGHFSLYRNKKDINNLFMNSPVYRQVFEDSTKHYAFDERSNIHGKKLDHQKKQEVFNNNIKRLANKIRFTGKSPGKTDLPDMNSVIRDASGKGRINLYKKNLVRSDNWFRKQSVTDWVIAWERGRLTDFTTGKQLLHFHFLKSKANPDFIIDPLVEDAAFQISSTGMRTV